jgi:hypothetical protein
MIVAASTPQTKSTICKQHVDAFIAAQQRAFVPQIRDIYPCAAATFITQGVIAIQKWRRSPILVASVLPIVFSHKEDAASASALHR